ncbi:hypothetical protein GCM10009612_18580 [Streptomyces beijiangensis]
MTAPVRPGARAAAPALGWRGVLGEKAGRGALGAEQQQPADGGDGGESEGGQEGGPDTGSVYNEYDRDEDAAEGGPADHFGTGAGELGRGRSGRGRGGRARRPAAAALRGGDGRLRRHDGLPGLPGWRWYNPVHNGERASPVTVGRVGRRAGAREDCGTKL